MVLQEVAQYGDVSELTLHGVMNEGQPTGVSVARDLEGFNEGVVHGVIEDGVQGSRTLILRRNGEVIPENFTHAENTSTGTERTPEAAVHVFGG